MMTSSNGNILRDTGPLWGESTGHRWNPFRKVRDAELWYFLWCAPEQTAEEAVEMPWRHDAYCDVTLASMRLNIHVMSL